jgi:hypothetical protein
MVQVCGLKATNSPTREIVQRLLKMGPLRFESTPLKIFIVLARRYHNIPALADLPSVLKLMADRETSI